MFLLDTRGSCCIIHSPNFPKYPKTDLGGSPPVLPCEVFGGTALRGTRNKLFDPPGQFGYGITCWPKLEPMLVAPLGSKTSGTTYNWPNLEPMHVAFFLDGEITQVKESIPWVRCASGNVLVKVPLNVLQINLFFQWADKTVFIHHSLECKII